MLIQKKGEYFMAYKNYIPNADAEFQNFSSNFAKHQVFMVDSKVVYTKKMILSKLSYN